MNAFCASFVDELYIDTAALSSELTTTTSKVRRDLESGLRVTKYEKSECYSNGAVVDRVLGGFYHFGCCKKFSSIADVAEFLKLW